MFPAGMRINPENVVIGAGHVYLSLFLVDL
jgi:hypothetical protein